MAKPWEGLPLLDGFDTALRNEKFLLLLQDEKALGCHHQRHLIAVNNGIYKYRNQTKSFFSAWFLLAPQMNKTRVIVDKCSARQCRFVRENIAS